MSEPQEEKKEEISYFKQRCEAIGITPENNFFEVPEYAAAYKEGKSESVFTYPIMCEDQKTGDIMIPLYTLKGEPATFYKDNPGKLQAGKPKPLEIRRYKPGQERVLMEKGKEKRIKYDTPKGAKALPWISPNIIEAVRERKHIDTIVITEGQIKAICGYLKGLHIFGINGHSNIKDRDHQTMHPDILETITACNVKNVVLLYDGDCNMIRGKDIEEEADLRYRPNQFFASARNSRELLKDYWKHHEFDVYFAHINSAELEGSPKGLDDLFEAYADDSEAILKELNSFSKFKNHFFHKINITGGLSKVLNHLHINTAEQYYTAHNQAIKEKLFVFNGTKYQWDSNKNELKVVIPGAAKNYFRVGDNYFEKLQIPNKNGVLEFQYHRRLVGTIQADHGKDFVKHIPKYKAFCTKPDHVNYEEVIHNCYNRYKPFEHEMSTTETECPETLTFLKHIFGSQYELGLDYVQLLFQRPTQPLPILCLVSKENNTGKSTFGKLLKAIFTGNMAFISNSDLESDFNAGWADKLIICCEESFIDKKKTVEKVKALTFGDKIQMNQKGIDHMEIDFFGKFIFMSNNEDNFVIANENDERFWVRRVPKYEGPERTDLMYAMIDEIPAFLHYLNKRKMHSENKGRMWFDKEALKTDALKKLIQGNKSVVEKEVRHFVRMMMLEHGFKELRYTGKWLAENVIKGRYEKSYIERVLSENLKLKTTGSNKRYKFPVIRDVYDEGKKEERLVIDTGLGKPYVFLAADFLTQEEIDTLQLCEEAKMLGQADVIQEKLLITEEPQSPIHTDEDEAF